MFQAKIIAKSISSKDGKEITTWELIYPRFIHSELMTHKMLSKNAASSRAIPVQKVIDMVRENPAMPVHWGKNQPGMQAHEELDTNSQTLAKLNWEEAALSAVGYALHMAELGVHKQIVNRILEPYQWMKTVMTGTEWANFYWLRNHEDAQPEFKHLAQMMWEENQKTESILLIPGEWHTPYYGNGYWIDEGNGIDFLGYSLQNALDISMSCCAQVSYRNLDDTLEKAQKVVERLNLGVDTEKPVHASPSEHQATPMKENGSWTKMPNLRGMKLVNSPRYPESWEEGITAYHKELGFMSGNFSGWIQNRQLIKGHTKW